MTAGVSVVNDVEAVRDCVASGLALVAASPNLLPHHRFLWIDRGGYRDLAGSEQFLDR